MLAMRIWCTSKHVWGAESQLHLLAFVVINLDRLCLNSSSKNILL